MKFRQDINALRAIAVIAVVIFHFNDNWLPGGFAGVDVFFVISGFLMTMIIFKGFDNQTFSLLTFYKARVRRIIPALAFLCFVLVLLGFFFLNPIDLKVLGKHVISSLSFTSNVVYWTESNYFNPSSMEKWLLHTWSLSVEWQFYLAYPLFLVFVKRFLSIPTIKLILLVCTVLGFVFSVWLTYRTSSAAYFLLPSRAWQMLIGGLIFLYPLEIKHSLAKWIQLAGLSAITISFFVVSKSTPWPGYWSLLPIIGTCLVLIAKQGDTIIVNNIITRSLGKWSYSIYLWHWPVVVAGIYFSTMAHWWSVGIPISLVLGALSYRLIETKTLADYRLHKLRILFAPIPASIAISAAGVVLLINNGFINLLPDKQRKLTYMAIEAIGDRSYLSPNLIIDGLKIRKIEGNSDKNILLLGASHIEHIFPYAENIKNEYNLYFLTEGGCFVTPSMENPKWACSNIQNYQKLFKSVKFDKIITSFYNFDGYLPVNKVEKAKQVKQRLKEYDQFLKTIKTHSKEVYLILGEPRGDEFDPKSVIRNNLDSFVSRKLIEEEYKIHSAALTQLTELSTIKIINPIDYLCNAVNCITRDENDGFYYSDKNHMRPWYVRQRATYLQPLFE